MAAPLSIYIHIPFCKKRCHYCDFNTLAGKDRYIASYFEALQKEIRYTTARIDIIQPVHSIYLGGGTPSYVDSTYITNLMSLLRESFVFTPDCEITIEANPGTVNLEKLSQYYHAGINRISLGVQSADDADLQRLGRIHTFQDVVETVQLVRSAGFTNLSVDLIFGLPEQTMQSWLETLEKTVSLQVEHISLYSLTIEEGTPFGTWHEQGLLQVPDDDFTADEYTAAQAWLKKYGFSQYEISNWAKVDQTRDLRSRHNCQYWRNLPYLGFGLGAHSCFQQQRFANTTNLGDYIQACNIKPIGNHANHPACIEVIPLESFTKMQETMMLGLRLIEEGVSGEAFYNRFGVSMLDIFHKEIGILIAQGLVTWKDEDHLVLSEHGVLLGNQVFIHFV